MCKGREEMALIRAGRGLTVKITKNINEIKDKIADREY
jgi:hypothetical protein